MLQVELEAVGENDLFAPVDDDMLSATIAPEGDQVPVKTMLNIPETMPMSTMVSSRGRTKKVSN